MTSPDDIRALRPPIAAAYDKTRRGVLDGGIVDRSIKDLCARYLAEGDEVVARTERERAALDWTHAIAWDDAKADDELWASLHASFTERELVDLGYYIAFTLGQQHWLATLEAPGAPGRPR
jgi:alkylhydroperoxidase family enzyme